MSLPLVGFAGMTHLGLVSATAVAAGGFGVICYDPDPGVVEQLGRGELHVVEPDLDRLLAENAARQRFSAEAADLGAADLVYVAADVPTDDDGQSDLSGIRSLIDRVAAALKLDAVLVVLSQVPPGFTRTLTALAPQRIYYQVETLVFGRAVERAMRPERYIIGCSEPGCPLPASLRTVLEAFRCPILTMRYESAELAKISINFCLVASIGVANTLAELCEQIGADWSEIVPALKLDRRIGPHAYLMAGLGIAGGNLERDLASVLRLSTGHATDTGIIRAWIANSRHRRDWAVRTIQHALLHRHPRAKLAIWGLAYKEHTNSVKNSPAIATIRQLWDNPLALHDPVVPASAARHPLTQSAATPLEALDGAEALMILTPWPVYRQFAAIEIARRMTGRILVDPYRVIDPQHATSAGLAYYTLGCAPLQPQVAA